MYFILALEINKSLPKNEMEEVFKLIRTSVQEYTELGYGKIINPLKNFLMIQCQDEVHRNFFLSEIKKFASINNKKIKFLASPLIDIDKGFSGSVPSSYHEQIKLITTNENKPLDYNLFL